MKIETKFNILDQAFALVKDNEKIVMELRNYYTVIKIKINEVFCKIDTTGRKIEYRVFFIDNEDSICPWSVTRLSIDESMIFATKEEAQEKKKEFNKEIAICTEIMERHNVKNFNLENEKEELRIPQHAQTSPVRG